MNSGKDKIDRLCEALGVSGPTELAAWLGIRQASVSQYNRKGEDLPSNWYLRASTEKNVNPEFVRTGVGPVYLWKSQGKNGEDPNKKFVSAIFKPDGQDQVYTEHPAAGLVTNASGQALPVPHYAEYVLAIEARGRLGADGGLELTGSGLPIPRERLKRWRVEPAGARSLRTALGLCIFDASQIEEAEGGLYIVAAGDILLARRYQMGADGPEWADPRGQAPTIPARGGHVSPRPMGRVVATLVEE